MGASARTRICLTQYTVHSFKIKYDLNYSTLCFEISEVSKQIKNLNVRLDTAYIKLLEENIGRTLFDINCSNIFLDLPPKVMKIKINKWGLIKLQAFAQKRKP